MSEAYSPRLRDLWRERTYMRFWGARICATAGSQMLMVAVGWQMYDLTGSAWDLGLVGLLQFAAHLLMWLPAGQAADRWPRGAIIATCLAVLAGVTGLLMLADGWGWMSRGLLLGLSLVLGTVQAFQMPAQQAIVPMLVPQRLLQRAMAFGAMGNEAAIIGGPALGGLIFVAGAGVLYATCMALFLAGALLMAGVRYARPASRREPMSWRGAFAGLAFIWHRKPVLGAISLDLFAVLLGGATALLPIYARDILGTGPWGLGLLRAAPAVGAVAMSIVCSRWPIERHVGRWLFGAVAVFGVATVCFGLSRHLWLSLAALVVLGMADMVNVVLRQTLVQLETPDDMRGRVSAASAIFVGGSNRLGEFESGALAVMVGAVGSVVLGGVGTVLVAALWWRWFPALARRDRMAG